MCTRNGRRSKVRSSAVGPNRLLTSQSGSWSLDPRAPQLPPPNLVQIILDGKQGKKSYCRRSSKGIAPTAKFSSRHGSIEATLHIVGNSLEDPMFRPIARIRSETRKGNTVLDVVSLFTSSLIALTPHRLLFLLREPSTSMLPRAKVRF
jgi:hypothetical protein